MSVAYLPQFCRSELDRYLGGNRLGCNFHQLFDIADEGKPTKKDKKPRNNRKIAGKTSKRDKSPVDQAEHLTPCVEVQGNPSSFTVYSAVRQSVLQQHIKRVTESLVYTCQLSQKGGGESEDSDAEEADRIKENALRLPKIVGIGLCGVFELLRETRDSHPMLCVRALKALLDMLQGQQPEGLKKEPADVIECLYTLLMDLATEQIIPPRGVEESDTLTSLASACLLSLVIARGDTAKLLSAVAAMLMSPPALAAQQMKVPGILVALQRSVQAVLLGHTHLPDWMAHGIRSSAHCLTIPLQNIIDTVSESSTGSCVACDGRHLYIHNSHGLYKIGTGYGGTVKGELYCANKKFHNEESGWLAYAKGMLFYQAAGESSGHVSVINPDSLQYVATYTIEGKGYGPNVMFCDGENLGHIATSRDDSFVVRSFSPLANPMPLVNELPLKLARKCIDVHGIASFDGEITPSSENTGVEEDAVSIAAGKDFALLRTPSGKMLYTGKSAALGIKQGGPSVGKWSELALVKSPKITNFSVGHDGLHALLVTEDGSVFFVGTPRRGEDGDGSLSKVRRQPKPVKPKKLIKMEGRYVVMSACNSGSSAMVTREGELFMFGKDTAHCEPNTGLVSELKEHFVTSVVLGKAHTVVLTSKGHVYSFGINNKGQCGREYVAGSSREMSTAVTMADEEEELESDVMCPPGKHSWREDQCMICTCCGECTGYGNSCISSGRPNRNPGQRCGCGAGDSGCVECGVCRVCACDTDNTNSGGEGEGGVPPPVAAAVGMGGILPVDMLARHKDMLPLDIFLGRQGAQHLDKLLRVEGRRGGAANRVRPLKVRSALPVQANHVGGGGEVGGAGYASDLEADRVKLNSIGPGRVELGRGDHTAVQIACGLQHTVVLDKGGEVFTFGSNQYGQLGLGDVNIRGMPCRVHLKHTVVQIAAGSNHTVLLTASGQVYTFGCHKKGQLGRPIPDPDKVKDKKGHWFALPSAIPGIGSKHGRRATWVGASGDQTFIRIDESLINTHTLARSHIVANSSYIGLIPSSESGVSSFKCLMITKSDGSCCTHNGDEQLSLVGCSVCLDRVYDLLWSYSPREQCARCYSVLRSEARQLKEVHTRSGDVLGPELAVPTCSGTVTTRSHTALHLLGVLDTVTAASSLGLTVAEDSSEKHMEAQKHYSREDFSIVNRFESHGGGWGYSGHSIEAIRFMTDTDILLGGFGLFGGRGEYFGKIKVFELGADGGENELDGDVVAETEDQSYECGAREKYGMLFEEPVLIQANLWYVAWARIQGPSSDCGSSGKASITTDDQVIFKFKNSSKSNNGTDINAGQIPQLLYRLPCNDSNGAGGKTEHIEPAHVLTRSFSTTVSPECFEWLLRLLQWSWETFRRLAAGDVRSGNALSSLHSHASLVDADRLIYISSSCLRLLRVYICEIYPNAGHGKSSWPQESTRLVECIGDARSALRKILSQSCPDESCSDDGLLLWAMWNGIAEECHKTFTACFHAFYPSPALKWTCLCELLNCVEPGHENTRGYGRLLAAVMEALCHPLVKLASLIPSSSLPSPTPSPSNDPRPSLTSARSRSVPPDNTATSTASWYDVSNTQYPLLVGHMIHRTEMESTGPGGLGAHWGFREVLVRLLNIVVLPVRQALLQDTVSLPSLLVANTSSMLSAIIGELAASATGAETDVANAGRPMLTSPTRFTRISPSAYWNTGNGSPDAVCFSVDKPGILVAGVTVYGGGGQYDFDLELLDDVAENASDSSVMAARWNTLESVKGTYSHDECVNDVAEIKLDKPVPIKENVKYALKLRNRGGRTLNGDSGMSKVKCLDGVTFTFSTCSLSSNGTNQTRGQIPSILYYSSPQEGDNPAQSNRAAVEHQARKQAITIATSIFRAATDLLHRAQGLSEKGIGDIMGKAPMFTMLLPMVAAYIGPVAAVEPRGAVQVLSLVQEVLRPIASLNMTSLPLPSLPSPTSLHPSCDQPAGEAASPSGSQHYAIVESEHPYKPASVANYKVTFPGNVRWMVLEFDPQCGTAQQEDTLQLYIPSTKTSRNPGVGALAECAEMSPDWWPVLKKFHGVTDWPLAAVVLPGNQVCFSLETASDYVKDEKACFYGFKCSVIGFEWNSKMEQGMQLLEQEISYLGGLCASSLMRTDILLQTNSTEEPDEESDFQEDTAHQVFSMHAGLLSRGFALANPPTIGQALDGNLPFSWASNERAFLKDLVQCTPGTSGGRLAAWLQPESYLDPQQSEIMYSSEDLRCGWPAVITVITKDQYGRVVHVPNLKVDVKAVPVTKDSCIDEQRAKRLSSYEESSLMFGGHSPPKLTTPYQVTTREKKDAFHAICMMKAYENYSFEELRLAGPAIRRPSENMLVRANNDGTYSANWTPATIGRYDLHVNMDGYSSGEACKVNVKDPPQGVAPPVDHSNKKTGQQTNKMRKFVGRNSAGLRVRVHPSLQSEMVGTIKPAGVISFIDEIHNDDGVWLRLSQESIKEWCTSSTSNNGLCEAWGLEYNQHLGKTLLVPVEEPKSIREEQMKDSMLRRLSDMMGERPPMQQPRDAGPGVYQVVKCGSSGHNVRCRPNRKSTAIGMVVLGNQVTAMETLVNGEGIWVRLDETTVSQYCHEVEGEAWSLAAGHDGIIYLRHEKDVADDANLQPSLQSFTAPFASRALSVVDKGFDFSGAAKQSLFFPGVMRSLSEGSALLRDDACTGNGALDKICGDFMGERRLDGRKLPDPDGAGASFMFGQEQPPAWPLFTKNGPEVTVHQEFLTSSIADQLSNSTKQPKEVSEGVGASRGDERKEVPVPPKRLDSLPRSPDIPPELQGVSVKDLVKALGKVRLEKGISRAIKEKYPAALNQDQNKGSIPDPLVSHKMTLESDMKGVSVKEIIRLLGESRVNGNGVTPPRTPPGTPKKAPSRSSSPKPPTGSRTQPTDAIVCPAIKPRRASSANTPPSTPPRTPPQPRRNSGGPPFSASSSLSTPPNTPPSLHRELVVIANSSLALHQPLHSCRSNSASPLRPDSPLSSTSNKSPGGSLGPSPVSTLGASPSPNLGPSPSSTLNTDTSTGPMKGHFNIGSSPHKEDVRMSPKIGRKDRNRQLRTKRDRPSSPNPRDKTPTGSRSGSLPRQLEPVGEAMSPSVAECMRAVFASFLWHEGIVHDAMACASYLKFHPNLPKEGLPLQRLEGSKTPGSSRVTPTGSLKKQHKDGAGININMNEAIRKLEMVKTPKERHNSDSKTLEGADGTASKSGSTCSTPPTSLKSGGMASGDSTLSKELPPTMRHLVYFWEELSGACVKIIQQNLILPGPAITAKMTKVMEKPTLTEKEKISIDKADKKNAKKAKKYARGRGNLFGEAAGGLYGAGGGSKETLCELCGAMFSHPVTYHMREAHAGCGRHAGGQGYNSGGHYCGGWAGNCGEGGVGGSTWYLLCERCHSAYLQEKRQFSKDKGKKSSKKKMATPSSTSSSVKAPADLQVVEPHVVMKRNAMFLLDLASSAGLSLPRASGPSVRTKQGSGVGRPDGILPSVSEDIPMGEDHTPFAPTPFIYLRQSGAEAADSAFSEDVVFCEPAHTTAPPQGLSLSTGGCFSPNHMDPRVSRSSSVGTAPSDAPIQQELIPPKVGRSKSAQVSPSDTDESIPERPALFQRSISEITAVATTEDISAVDEELANNDPNLAGLVRRRNISGDGGMSLLKHPSSAMFKLIQSVERGGSLGRMGLSGERALQRPVMAFVIQRHNLDSLQQAMKQSIRKAACRVYAMQAFNWLVRSVTQASSIHSLLWHFVASLSTAGTTVNDGEDEEDERAEKRDQDQEGQCEHPLWDIRLAGEAVHPLLHTFHTFLQTVSDVMMYLPPGSALQQMAVRCWCLKFRSTDHMFLHKSHVFSNISKILSRSDEGWGGNGVVSEQDRDQVGGSVVECLKDLSQAVDIKASSRQAMIASLTDNTTETFWESGDEDRNKVKTLTITCSAAHTPIMLYIHVDNSRDLGNKVGSVVFSAGETAENTLKISQYEFESRHVGWVYCLVRDPLSRVLRVEMKGPDNTLRLRQVKVLGRISGSSIAVGHAHTPLIMQQKNCETETLKVFRLLTSQVFGRLISDEEGTNEGKNGAKGSVDVLDEGGDVDLKEHMVSILFSRSKLSHLQKQVCVHIVQAIRKEASRVQEEWEEQLSANKSKLRSSDAYCFELLSMVLALSGSAVGRSYLAQQHHLLQDLLSLLHTASPRVQRQVTAVVRRVLPQVEPQTLAHLLNVPTLPPKDFSILASSSSSTSISESSSSPPQRHPGILDVFLACIAKALTLQSKVKSQGAKSGSTSYRLADCITHRGALSEDMWWLRGTCSTQLAETIICLLKDLAAGVITEEWAAVTKSAIAEAILALTKLDEGLREPSECIQTSTLWLAVASLCVMDQEHVERLSSGQWSHTADHATHRPLCENHDDGETGAIILCSECGNLCADCDRFLHLNKRTRSHQRQVFKEEEEAIRVDLHEACGRTKLYWLMALADSKTLKAMVEFRDQSKDKLGSCVGGVLGSTCRFCGGVASPGLLPVGNVCSHAECLEHAGNACTKTLACGHLCGGIHDEVPCLPCLHGCSRNTENLKQDADDMCMICFTEALSAAPAIQLECGHVFHLHCSRRVLQRRWVGPRITFGFSLCPICKAPIHKSVLDDLLEPIRVLYQDVQRKALMRLEYEGLHQSSAITDPGARFHADPGSYALDRYAYYVCYKCGKAYYGGEARCEEQAGAAEEYDPAELVCGGCSDVSRAQMCPKHGTDFLEYKCRYCCSVAVFFCFGTTHFCNACHDDFQRVTSMPKPDLPHCPVGPKAKQLNGQECPLHVDHPPTGEEFALGCGVCRNAHTF